MATETKINGKMVVLARESRGLTQKDLADQLGITPGKLCKAELGEQTLSDEQMKKLESLLGYPVSFYAQDAEPFIPTHLSFRQRKKVPQKLIFPIEAMINVYRLHAEWLFKRLQFTLPVIPSFDLSQGLTPQEAAVKLRNHWMLNPGPVNNLAALLEKNNIPVLSFDFGTERVDSRLILTQTHHPLVFINSTLLGDRLRFSLAIALGHLVMHAHTQPALDRETGHEANLFAAEFLMPEKDILPDLSDNLSVFRLAELKIKWKVSMHALLFRAEDLGVVTYNQKNYLLTQFNQLNIRRREPVQYDVPLEKGFLMRDLLTAYRQMQKINAGQLAQMLHIKEDELLKMYN